MTLVRHLPTTSAKSFISLWGIPSGPVVLFALSGLIIVFISSLKAEGKSKHKEFDKTVFCGYNTRMVFVSFNVVLSWHWELELLIQEDHFLEMVYAVFM